MTRLNHLPPDIDKIDPPDLAAEADEGQPVTVNDGKNNGLMSILLTAGIIIAGIVIVAIFKEDINNIGLYLINRYGRQYIDIILFVLTAISSSPICLPVWQYVLIGTTMGYSVIRLALIMAFGSALGSLVTYYTGRLFGNSKFFRKRFPNAEKNRWVHGRSRLYVTLALFLGTASPIPFDILYFACGVKKYPPLLLYTANTLGRLIRYTYLGYGFYLINS
jgi:membrane protein YqaA with SNARE-associated domain